MNQAPLSLEKFIRKTGKWLLFSVFVLALTHTFLAYFVGADRVLEMTSLPPSQNWTNFTFVWALSGILLFDLAWFREQFCVIMCPYGRFQSTMLDRHSVTVAYDSQRGEPRRGWGTKSLEGAVSNSKPDTGDCVACNRCVQVCPTGIDIRNGLQMECIACTACIDACDEIMEKVGKPQGLIRYKPLDPALKKPNWFRPRVVAYMGIWLVLFASLTYALNKRSELKAILLRQSGLPYQVKELEDGPAVINTFRVHLINHLPEEKQLRIEISPSHFEWLGPKPAS
jgi:cytochrome c oxidase accessory protein FixG